MINKLRVDTSEHPIHYTEPTNNSNNDKELTAEIFFELFKVPAMFSSIAGVLALFSTGRTTGLAVDSGFGKTEIFPVYHLFSLRHAIKRISIGGSNLTSYIREEISNRNRSVFKFRSSAQFLDKVKKEDNNFYVAWDYEEELSKLKKRNSEDGKKWFELPDGDFFELGSEQISGPEILFRPEIIYEDFPGIHERCSKAIMGCDIDLRRYLFANITVSGGNSAFEGFYGRLQREISSRCPRGVRVSVKGTEPVGETSSEVRAQYAVNSAWEGGSLLSVIRPFRAAWLTRDEYLECGPGIVRRKCF